MNNLPAAKIKMMQESIRCLTFGLLGLVPLIGLPFALAALWLAGRVRLQEKQFWNAAKPCRVIGVACAALGTVAWFIIGALVVFQIIADNTRG
jgi:hypothetical protein